MRIIVGISGASGAIYGIRLLEVLSTMADVETHLVLSKGGKLTVALETAHTVKSVESLADVVHSDQDLAATIASGSFHTDAMIVAPCAMKTLSGIVNSYADKLLVRAADVILKERRPLVLCVRETPLSDIHLENMLKLSRMGVTILPPMPAFYNHPENLDDIVNHIVARVLDQFGIDCDFEKRWDGDMKHQSPKVQRVK